MTEEPTVEDHNLSSDEGEEEWNHDNDVSLESLTDDDEDAPLSSSEVDRVLSKDKEKKSNIDWRELPKSLLKTKRRASRLFTKYKRATEMKQKQEIKELYKVERKKYTEGVVEFVNSKGKDMGSKGEESQKDSFIQSMEEGEKVGVVTRSMKRRQENGGNYTREAEKNTKIRNTQRRKRKLVHVDNSATISPSPSTLTVNSRSDKTKVVDQSLIDIDLPKDTMDVSGSVSTGKTPTTVTQVPTTIVATTAKGYCSTGVIPSTPSAVQSEEGRTRTVRDGEGTVSGKPQQSTLPTTRVLPATNKRVVVKKEEEEEVVEVNAQQPPPAAPSQREFKSDAVMESMPNGGAAQPKSASGSLSVPVCCVNTPFGDIRCPGGYIQRRSKTTTVYLKTTGNDGELTICVHMERGNMAHHRKQQQPRTFEGETRSILTTKYGAIYLPTGYRETDALIIERIEEEKFLSVEIRVSLEKCMN